jgi:hypothetical protein
MSRRDIVAFLKREFCFSISRHLSPASSVVAEDTRVDLPTECAPTNLVFEGLTVTRYATAISFNGNRNDVAQFKGRNRIIGNRFIDIGGDDDKGRDSTAVIRFVNSDDNIIENNLFKGVVRPNRRQHFRGRLRRSRAIQGRLQRERCSK